MEELLYIDAEGRKERLPMQDLLRIGRHVDQDVRVLDLVVSKRHAILRRSASGWELRDLESRNGTWLNGGRIADRATVRPGDEIRIGSARFFLLRRGEESPTAPVDARVALEVQSSVHARVRGEEGSAFLPVDEIDDPQRLRRDYEKLRLASELSRALRNEFGQGRLIAGLLERALALFGAERALFLRRSVGGEWEPAAMRVRDESEGSASAGSFLVSRTLLREVVEERRALLSNDAMTDARFDGAHSIMLQGIRATMSAPLIHGGEVRGVLSLDSRLMGARFTEQDLELFTGFAAQAATLLAHADLLDERRRDALARERLGRLLPPDLVEEVVQGRVLLEPGGEYREATVLFADIRGFTGISERVEAEAVVELLNGYFERMVDVIFRHGGTLDKFIGDALMAVWGAPIPQEGHPFRAAEAARQMRRELRRFNADRARRGEEELRVGMGLSTGRLIAGFVGSHQAMNYTVVGDVVNVASRLCGIAEPDEILVCGPMAASLGTGEGLEELATRTLKGRSADTRVFRLLDR